MWGISALPQTDHNSLPPSRVSRVARLTESNKALEALVTAGFLVPHLPLALPGWKVGRP